MIGYPFKCSTSGLTHIPELKRGTTENLSITKIDGILIHYLVCSTWLDIRLVNNGLTTWATLLFRKCKGVHSMECTETSWPYKNLMYCTPQHWAFWRFASTICSPNYWLHYMCNGRYLYYSSMDVNLHITRDYSSFSRGGVVIFWLSIVLLCCSGEEWYMNRFKSLTPMV